MDIRNLFANLPAPGMEESFETLLSLPSVRIERIVSQGHVTTGSDWYDQEQDEWVLVLKGSAQLLFEGQAKATRMVVGDWVFIPAHCRHRVVRSDQAEPTIWLAVHIGAQGH